MDDIIKEVTENEYQHGFVTEVEQELIPKGLSEDVIRLISQKKNEPQWLLDFRLDAYRKWCKMEVPTWAHLRIPPIDFQDIIYYAAPKAKGTGEIDPELEKTFDKLGIPLSERRALAGLEERPKEGAGQAGNDGKQAGNDGKQTGSEGGVAFDAVFDSVSVKTTFRKTLAEKGIIFCSFSEAVQE